MKPFSGHFVVMHYHLRPGGVRRVIEMALPALARAGGVRRVTLLVGEGGADEWVAGLRAALGDVALEVVVAAGCGYSADQGEVVRPDLEGICERGCVVWVHNLGLGRNLLLAREVVALAERGRRVVSHHHDFWFENRWGRWAEMTEAGVTDLAEVGRVIFSPALRHAVINGQDARGVEGSLLLPNPVMAVGRGGGRSSAGWLRELLGDDGPVWVAATRFLRRKNLAEAVLLHRWLRPEGWLVTTAGVSSREEESYARALMGAAERGGWRVRFSLLASGDGPEIGDLIAGCEAVVMTSVQEGFGLPYLEAAAAGKPLVARRLPNVMPDLEGWGFRFPQSYDEVWIAAELVDLEAEAKRQGAVFSRWREGLPEEVRELAEAPRWLIDGNSEPMNGLTPFATPFAEPMNGLTPFVTPFAMNGLTPFVPFDSEPMNGLTPLVTPLVAFGRLTLAGQLAVLAIPPEESWAACAGLNPGMGDWRGELAVTPWPVATEAELGVERYTARFWSEGSHAKPRGCEGGEIQGAMIRERLGAGFLFAILME